MSCFIGGNQHLLPLAVCTENSMTYLVVCFPLLNAFNIPVTLCLAHNRDFFYALGFCFWFSFCVFLHYVVAFFSIYIISLSLFLSVPPSFFLSILPLPLFLCLIMWTQTRIKTGHLPLRSLQSAGLRINTCSKREARSQGRSCQMDLISMKNRVSHLLRKGRSWGLMGNKSGFEYGVNRRWMERLSFSDPPWVVLKFIFLKARVWAQAPLKASLGSDPFIFLSLYLRCMST